MKFEDDVIFIKDFQDRIKHIKDVDWKLLYFGASQFYWNRSKIKNNFYLANNTYGTFAYAVHASLYDELIAKFSKAKKSVDNILIDVQKKHYGECYAMYPNVVIADTETSDIRAPHDLKKYASKVKWDLDLYCNKKRKKKILLVPDTPNWAFDNIANAIIKYNPYPDEIEYHIVYVIELLNETKHVNVEDWDLIYVMFEGERCLPECKHMIRGFYSAFWLENAAYTPEYISKYFSKCGGAVFVNPELRRHMLPHLDAGFSTEVIYDAADDKFFHPTKTKKHINFTVLYVGNTKRVIKNFDEIKEICEKAGVNLKVCENVSHKSLLYEYNKSDVMINFSTFEGGPQTFIEASLCKIPTLIRENNELSKLIPCFTGKNKEEFIDILSRLKSNRTECKKKGAAAYKVAIANFTYKKVAKKFADFFMQVKT